MITKLASVAVALLATTLPASAAAGAPLPERGAEVSKTAGPLVVFANPYGNSASNPVEDGTARVYYVVTPDATTIVTLNVWGLAPNRAFGAHVHLTPCEVNKGSGHYQNVPGIVSESNEIWLDFTTDAQGDASATAVRDWRIRPDGAHSVIIHDHGTDQAAGTAGPRLGCLNVDF